jgi:hypothetical protein
MFVSTGGLVDELYGQPLPTVVVLRYIIWDIAKRNTHISSCGHIECRP